MVIGAHGCSGMLRRDDGAVTALYRGWARQLTEAGIALLLVDSFTPRGFATVCNTDNVNAQRDRPRDMAGALAHARTRPDIDADRIALMGWSHGGGVVVSTVTRDLGFKAAIAVYPGACSVRAQGAGWKPPIPLLVLIGEADDWTPLAPCRDLAEYGRRQGADIEFVAYPGAHHGFDGFGPVQQLKGLQGAIRGQPPTVGAHPEARADAYARSIAFLKSRLGE
ncbi:MAG: dienelactone hydrolase family protein [Alphaproteobacteria bacterium]|nr:dienelactone hydrolase family protein [Alphaproteobacteria bacterium]